MYAYAFVRSRTGVRFPCVACEQHLPSPGLPLPPPPQSATYYLGSTKQPVPGHPPPQPHGLIEGAAAAAGAAVSAVTGRGAAAARVPGGPVASNEALIRVMPKAS